MTERLSSFELPGGTNKKGQAYDRRVGYGPGMKELVQVVAGLQKDVKRLNNCLTLEGATAYAAKQGRNWSAHEADITGPNGKPDGINEVFVTDGKGNVKVINGYELTKTTYPIRKLYRTVYKTKEDRKAKPFTEFTEDLSQISNSQRAEDGSPMYEIDIHDLSPDPQFANVRKGITPRNFFKQIVFDPQYQAQKEALKQSFSPMQMAQIYNKALSAAFNECVRDPIFTSHNLSSGNMKDSAIAKVVKSKDFQTAAAGLIDSVRDDDNKANLWSEICDRKVGEIAGTLQSAPDF